MELQNVSIAFISRSHFEYSPHSTDRKWCLFANRKKAFIFATPTKQFLLADEEFSSKNPNNWAAWNYRMWVLRLSHVFIFIIHLNRQEVMFVSDSKDKSYLRDTNETIFASRWRVFIEKKKQNNWAAWNCRTWVMRLSHVFTCIIHLIQQTGSNVCLRFKR